jgi:HD superfamily phosphohydrolase
MADWGLTERTRRTKPYDLHEWWLKPAKVITDPIHGDVFLTNLEKALLDTPPVQRLRRVRQLGTTHLVYPGATHSRFTHSLGALRVVQTLLDAVIGQRDRNHATPDLFEEWEAKAKVAAFDGTGAGDGDAGTEEPIWLVDYRRKLGEVAVLARLGALLHDLCHVPFGHTIEDDLKLLVPHDEGRARFQRLWRQVMASAEAQTRLLADRVDPRLAEDTAGHFSSGPTPKAEDLLSGLEPLKEGGRLAHDLGRLILSSEKDENGKRIDPVRDIDFPFVADMVGNTICADLLDYLQRDHTFSGLPISLGQRYLSSFYITPGASGGIYQKRMALLIHRGRRIRLDIQTEILKHLRYRYELQERVLVHHTKLAADAMIGKMFELFLDAERRDLEQDENGANPLDTVPPDFELPGGEAQVGPFELAARWRLEELLLTSGDDGLLERLSQETGSASRRGAAELARALLERRLYKPAGSAVGAANAEDLYTQFGDKAERRRLEQAACAHAEIPHDARLVLWIPDPDMRLKLAELLVNDGKGVAKFKDKSDKGSDIYDAHKDLWTISVFVHPEVTLEQSCSALAYLGRQLDVSWDRHEEQIGSDPGVGPEHLAAVRAFGTATADIRSLVHLAKSNQIAARGGGELTQPALDAKVKGLAEARGLITGLQSDGLPPDT